MLTRFVVISILLHLAVPLAFVYGGALFREDKPYTIANVRINIASAAPVTNLAKGGRISTSTEEQEAARARRETPSPPPPTVSPNRRVSSAPKPRSIPPVPPRKEAEPEIKKTPVSAPVPKPPKPTPPPLPVSNPRRVEAENRLNKLARQKQREQAGKGVLQNLAQIQVASKEAEIKRRNQEKLRRANEVRRTLEDTIGDAAKAREQRRFNRASLALVDKISLHIARCWEPPVGAAANLVVDIAVVLDSNGGVARADMPLDDPGAEARFNESVSYRAAVHAAKRALHRCSPLPIPPEMRAHFKEFVLEFNPEYLKGL